MQINTQHNGKKVAIVGVMANCCLQHDYQELILASSDCGQTAGMTTNYSVLQSSCLIGCHSNTSKSNVFRSRFTQYKLDWMRALRSATQLWQRLWLTLANIKSTSSCRGRGSATNWSPSG